MELVRTVPSTAALESSYDEQSKPESPTLTDMVSSTYADGTDVGVGVGARLGTVVVGARLGATDGAGVGGTVGCGVVWMRQLASVTFVTSA